MNAEPFFLQMKQRLSQLLPSDVPYRLHCDITIALPATRSEELREQCEVFRVELQAALSAATQAVFPEPQPAEKAPKNGSHPARPTVA